MCAVPKARAVGEGLVGGDAEKQYTPPGGSDFVQKRWPVGVCVNSVLL